MLCVDDYGNEVHTCRYTKKPVSVADGVIVGANIPGVKAAYLMATTTEAKEAKKQSDIWFHESEANCNTCKNLVRLKHAKRKDGALLGKCQHGAQRFHPDDPMHMPCYVSRWS